MNVLQFHSSVLADYRNFVGLLSSASNKSTSKLVVAFLCGKTPRLLDLLLHISPSCAQTATTNVQGAPDQALRDSQIRRDLMDRGYRVVVIRYDRSLEEQIGEHSNLFGMSSGG